MRQFNIPALNVSALRFTPDGRSLYLLSVETHISPENLNALPQHAYRVDVDSGELTGDWTFPASEIAIFSPDLCMLYYWPTVDPYTWQTDRHNHLHALDLGRNEADRIYSFEDIDAATPQRCAISPDGNFLALVEFRREDVDVVHRLDLRTRTELEPLKLNAGRLAYSHDGRLLATCELSSGLRVWGNTTRVARWNEPAYLAEWSADGRLAWGMDTGIFVARPESPEPPRSCGSLDALLSGLAFAPDGRLLLSGTRAGVCAFHDTLAGVRLTAFEWNVGAIHSVAFSPDGLTCAAGGEKGQVVVWDVDV